MVLFRFLTGLGLGAAMPNIGTLVSEYAPERQRSFLITIIFAASPLAPRRRILRLMANPEVWLALADAARRHPPAAVRAAPDLAVTGIGAFSGG